MFSKCTNIKGKVDQLKKSSKRIFDSMENNAYYTDIKQLRKKLSDVKGSVQQHSNNDECTSEGQTGNQMYSTLYNTLYDKLTKNFQSSFNDFEGKIFKMLESANDTSKHTSQQSSQDGAKSNLVLDTEHLCYDEKIPKQRKPENKVMNSRVQRAIASSSTRATDSTKTFNVVGTDRNHQHANVPAVTTPSPPLVRMTPTTTAQMAVPTTVPSTVAVPASAPEAHSDRSNNDGSWQQVKGRRSRRSESLVIGSNSSNTTVKGVEKKAFLHVTRIDPNVTEKDMTSFMKNCFPEVKVGKLNSKRPDLYASFKVEINQSNFKSAMCADKWPKNACIRHFLQRKEVQTAPN
nr:unnamed protein product [Callosobruchus analis]